MIRLQPLTEPVWVAHPRGVRVHLRRLTTRHFERANARAQARMREVSDGSWTLAEYGIPQVVDGDRLNVADPFQMSGLASLLGSVECALLGVIAWEGVSDGEGKAVPVDRRWLTLFLQDAELRAWLDGEITLAARILAAEGNGSGLSDSGSSPSPAPAEGPTTAPAVPAAASAAASSAAETPAAISAPEPNTRRARKRGSGPGASSSGSGPGAAAD